MPPTYDFSYFPNLETQRLRLRQLTHDDADVIVNVFGSPEVLRFLNMPPVDTHDKAIALLNWFEGNYQNKTGIDWGITLRGDGQLIGMCGAYDWHPSDRHIDIGYHILPAFWGKGYATEAARAIIGWCFENLDVHRIQGDCTDGHIASERVMLKCSFKVEGVWREKCWEHGRFVDIKQFGLLRHEFPASPE
jgi:ribosomal-protein-alanine N-acetyltransferase